MVPYEEVQAQSRQRELHWLLEEVVKSEFVWLIEILHICSNLLLYNSPRLPDPAALIERSPSITLAVSSRKLEELKGILVRDGAHVTKLNVSLRERHFNRLASRLVLKKPMVLPQIINAKRSIDNAVELIVQALSLLEVTPGNNEDAALSLKELQVAKNSLQLPTEPELVFPAHVTPKGSFEPEISSQIAVDVYISQAEVCVDLKDLHVVTQKPWSEIDAATGQSYADQVREQILRKKDVDKDDKTDLGVMGLISKRIRKPKYESQDFIARCVTFNNLVVIVTKKIEVSTADPILVSVITKLDSVEHVVSSFLENIRKLM
ncbi:hypothetical protein METBISCDRAFT_19435 [Metschnikowia bicuspidata]|uniref:RAVE subunit 2/Rogdi n=1 Tax=Metschnikowia bicuspidata TaxID=27322 RepID=A0A4P9Z8P9_9ASCO|nr:hypothetical protein METBISCDRAFT_19435 [Metschnikowia bicuspidata]